MKKGTWTLLAVVVSVMGFLGGYSISSQTGTEPGYFEAVEAAGYGGGAELIEGISEEMQEYYKSLTEE